MWTLFLLHMICWKKAERTAPQGPTSEDLPLNSCMRKSFRSKWIYQAIVSLLASDFLPLSTQQLSCRATGLMHHLCNRARAQREVTSWTLISSFFRRQTRSYGTRHSQGNKHRDGKHRMSRIKGLGVALCAVSGTVNHWGTQALQLLPRGGGGTQGLGLRSQPFSWWLLALLPAIKSPPVLHLTSSVPPYSLCLLPFPWLNSTVESAQLLTGLPSCCLEQSLDAAQSLNDATHATVRVSFWILVFVHLVTPQCVNTETCTPHQL